MRCGPNNHDAHAESTSRINVGTLWGGARIVKYTLHTENVPPFNLLRMTNVKQKKHFSFQNDLKTCQNVLTRVGNIYALGIPNRSQKANLTQTVARLGLQETN